MDPSESVNPTSGYVSVASDHGEEVAAVILDAYRRYRLLFNEIAGRAAGRFAARDWHGLQEDAAARLDLYGAVVAETVAAVTEVLGESLQERDQWSSAKKAYVAELAGCADPELAQTYFNSITRRVFHTEGVDGTIEFLSPEMPAPDRPEVRRVGGAPAAALLEQLLGGFDLGGRWQNLARDAHIAGEEITRRLELLGMPQDVAAIEVLDAVFYRGQGAYIVGGLEVDGVTMPIAVAIHHAGLGLAVGAVLFENVDVSVLFSYTRAPFHVAADDAAAVVSYLEELMPHKPRAELYTALGHHKHGKTELYRDFMAHISATDERFEHARGIKGMVMIVFTVPGYDVVFKVIRDRFPYPKQTTRRQVMAKYRMVFRHDRAGRLIDANEFEQLRFPRDRFTPELLDELQAQATRSVTVDEDAVTLHHVYVERRVTPLDIYVREANPVKARAAIVDYGRAIKNLAATNIFPGDMLLKNFGVTRSGRVVFYDYDELTELEDCNFREMPDTSNPHDEMAADPWFGVGEGDVFPEEFTRFLGIRGELRDAFDHYHRDLFGVRFWQRIQDRLKTGEVIEIFPYRRSRRLGAALRQRTERQV